MSSSSPSSTCAPGCSDRSPRQRPRPAAARGDVGPAAIGEILSTTPPTNAAPAGDGPRWRRTGQRRRANQHTRIRIDDTAWRQLHLDAVTANHTTGRWIGLRIEHWAAERRPASAERAGERSALLMQEHNASDAATDAIIVQTDCIRTRRAGPYLAACREPRSEPRVTPDLRFLDSAAREGATGHQPTSTHDRSVVGSTIVGG